MLRYRRILIPIGAGVFYLSLMVIFNNLLREPLMVSFATNISLVISAVLCVNFVPGVTERPRLDILRQLTPNAAFLIGAVPLAFVGQLIVQSAAVYFPAGSNSVSLPDLATVCFYFMQAIFLAPLAEEILFRGVLHGTFRTVISPFASAVFSSVLFGMLHGSFVSAILMSLVGFYFALVFDRTQNLVFVMLTHMTYNAAIFVSLFVLRGCIIGPICVGFLFVGLVAALLLLWQRQLMD